MNTIKYSLSPQSNAIKKGNMWLGITDSGYGESEISGFWQGYEPTLEGYTIYMNKIDFGPAIYSPSDNNELVSLISHFSLGGSGITGPDQAIGWVNDRDNMLIVNFDYPLTNLDNNIVFLDAGFIPSYPRSGTTWKDLSPLVTSNDGILSSESIWSQTNLGCFNFTGSQYITLPYDFFSHDSGSPFTVTVWFKSLNRGVIFGQQSSSNISTSPNYVPAIYIDDTGNLRTSCFWGGSSSNQSNLGIVNDGNWHEITVTYDGTSQRSYLDGVLSATLAKTQVSYGDGNYYYYLGAGRSDLWPNITTNYFTGSIAVFRFFTKRFSDSEVLANFNSLYSRFAPPITTTTTSTSTTSTTTAPPTTTTTSTTTTSSTTTSTTSTTSTSTSTTTTTTASPAGTVTFSQTFTQNVAPTTAIETAWNTFRSSLTGTYTTFKFFSNLDAGVTVTDAVNVQTLANALRNATNNTSVTINSVVWRVGTGCGTPKIGGVAVEFSNIASCSASSTYALRPMINNANWGNVNGYTVGAPTQTITLQFS